LISVEKNAPIDEVIEAGFVPLFVTSLKRDDFPALQFEAAWAITNICSGSTEHIEHVVKAGAMPILIKLLDSDEVCEQVRMNEKLCDGVAHVPPT